MVKSFQALSQKMNAYELASHIGKTTKLVAELYNDKTIEGVSRYENIQELLNSIKEFVEEILVQGTEEEVLDKSLGSFLQNVTLLTGDEKERREHRHGEADDSACRQRLEFGVMYVVGVEENLFPGTQSLYSLEDLEEERRLFYVCDHSSQIALVFDLCQHAL